MAFTVPQTLADRLTEQDWLLYQNIQNFSLDAIDAELSFSQRLARENRWSRHEAQAAIEEYKKYVFLVMVAPHFVVPSEQVDQVWHLHLIYTKSYWEDFCGRILPRPLHHRPTQGGPQELHKHVNAYQQTLATYEQIFGEPAPELIWPKSDRRFNHDVQVSRINVMDHWVIPKGPFHPEATLGRSIAFIQQSVQGKVRSWMAQLSPNQLNPAQSFTRNLVQPVLLFMMLTLTGCTIGQNPLSWLFSMPPGEFLAFYFLMGVVSIVAGYWVRWWHRLPHAKIDQQPLDDDEVAYLSGGERRVMELAVTRLLKEEHIEVVNSKLVARQPIQDRSVSHSIDHKVLQKLDCSEGLEIHKLQTQIAHDLVSLKQRLVDRGLLLSLSQQGKLVRSGSLLLNLTLVLGVLRAASGWLNGKPIGFLIGLMVFFWILGCTLWISPDPTHAGVKRLKEMRKKVSLPSQGIPTPATDVVFLSLALYGGSALIADPALSSLSSVLSPSSSAGSSGGGSDGGGGGGCGGGCGGCGGCGG